jgi:S1-C subfamily serine protease
LIIGGVSLLVLLIGVGIFALMQSSASDYKNMQGPVGIKVDGSKPTRTEVTSPEAARAAEGPAPKAALGAALSNGADGAVVQAVLPGSSAEAAGLLKGDVIVQVGDGMVTTIIEVLDQMQQYNIGDEVTLRVRRGQEMKDLKVKLMPRAAVSARSFRAAATTRAAQPSR